MEFDQRDKKVLAKWKNYVMVGVLALLILIGLLIYFASDADAQTQNLNYKLTWTNGAVLPDQSNKPDGTVIQQRVRAAGQTTFTEWVEIGRTVWPIAEFSDSISGDPGGRSICYQVAHFNKAGRSPFTPEACVITPVVMKIPTTPNNSAPIIIIVGPTTIP